MAFDSDRSSGLRSLLDGQDGNTVSKSIVVECTDPQQDGCFVRLGVGPDCTHPGIGIVGHHSPSDDPGEVSPPAHAREGGDIVPRAEGALLQRGNQAYCITC